MDNKKTFSPIGSWEWTDQVISSVQYRDPVSSSVHLCGSPFDSHITGNPVFCIDLNSASCRSL